MNPSSEKPKSPLKKIENPELTAIESFLEQKEKMMFIPPLGVEKDTLEAILQPKKKY